MNKYRGLIEQLDMRELDMPDSFKEAVRPAVEYLLNTHASFSVAIRLAALMLESYKGDLKVAARFAAVHPENRVEVYSSPDVFLAFYFLMLAAKVDNLYCTNEEAKACVCNAYSLTCAQDHETCSMCREKYQSGSIHDCTYETVPPFHVGCRCGMLFEKEA